jgi:hypothetical protein
LRLLLHRLFRILEGRIRDTALAIDDNALFAQVHEHWEWELEIHKIDLRRFCSI